MGETTPQDFLDTLATGRDRVAAAENLVRMLEGQGFRVIVRVRKYKGKSRFYFDVIGAEIATHPTKNMIVAWTVVKCFPDARLISRSSSTKTSTTTWAER